MFYIYVRTYTLVLMLQIRDKIERVIGTARCQLQIFMVCPIYFLPNFETIRMLTNAATAYFRVTFQTLLKLRAGTSETYNCSLHSRKSCKRKLINVLALILCPLKINLNLQMAPLGIEDSQSQQYCLITFYIYIYLPTYPPTYLRAQHQNDSSVWIMSWVSKYWKVTASLSSICNLPIWTTRQMTSIYSAQEPENRQKWIRNNL